MKTLWKQVFQYVLGGMIIISLLATVIILIFSDLSDSVHDALMIVLGVQASGFTAVIGYFFGSSKGSSDKNEIINKGPIG